ncbi:MAG: protein-disulfide reductase DsbD family protein [bacterium]|nr:protein-disulfide reductase DsbD family protein [bacterium]
MKNLHAISGIIIAIFSLLCASSVEADESSTTARGHVSLRLVSDRSTFQPGEEAALGQIGVLISPEPGWHVYWKNPGESGVATNIRWTSPESIRIGELLWPVPEVYEEEGNITTYGYGKPFLLHAALHSQPIEHNSKYLKIEADIELLACKDLCVPGKAHLEREFPFSRETPEEPSAEAELFVAAQNSLPGVNKKHFEVSTDLAFSATKQDFIVTINLKGPATSTISAKDIQVFPYGPSGVDYELPRINIHGNSLSIKLHGIYFQDSIPSEITPVAQPSVGGILALNDPEETKNPSAKTNQIIALEWSTDTSAATGILTEQTLPLKGEIASLRLHAPDDLLKIADVSPLPAQQTSLLLALFSAFIGGIILNLMPCVLPILSIKVMCFVQHGDKSPQKIKLAALSYLLGILSSMLALALVVISLRSIGEQFGWGFQFQHPEFVLALLLCVFILSLGFFDVFTFRVPFVNRANKIASALESSLAKNFFDGVLATLLSTPCTAPFLGTALAFAFTQPSSYTILTFLSIGLGLALPYVYLATHPRMLSLLPKPGDWMYTFREFMGFLLLGTALWLLFVLHSLVGEGVLWCVALLLIVYFLFWFEKHVEMNKISNNWKNISKIIVYSLMCFLLYLLWPKMVALQQYQELQSTTAPTSGSQDKINWERFTSDVLLSPSPQAIFLEFTAEWCITCKANTALIVETAEVRKVIHDNSIRAVKADWTSGDPDVSRALNSLGGTGVPLYAIIPAGGGKPEVLSSLFSQKQLIESLQNAARIPQ